ncbi:CBS domain-containing protein [Kitasatospora sp. NPDC059795]|uniref:CBS domain-containing protein n=1 Tax=unclassified Kitasatospora TaxID=2633591 RepID=UPI00093BF54A|nr:CBS domain-containing protein [Kitasatospora sp. CB01950]OKJ13992.1 hypoxic response protein 1 [Kitasatospora sp. CB01950]
MTTAKEIMHPGAECVTGEQTLADAARIMRERDVGALPICGENQKLLGIVTDRDIVLRCVAEGRDPSTVQCLELALGRPMVIEENEDADLALGLMEDHRVRRLPVINHPDHKLVGMISEADIARHLSQERLAEFVTAVTAR